MNLIIHSIKENQKLAKYAIKIKNYLMILKVMSTCKKNRVKYNLILLRDFRFYLKGYR